MLTDVNNLRHHASTSVATLRLYSHRVGTVHSHRRNPQQELNAADFDLSLTGFDPGEIDGLLAIPDEELANATPPVPENPVSRVGDLWICGRHRVLCGDALRPEDVGRLLGDRKPILMVTDPPYGIELDSEWRDRAGLNGCGPAEASYMKQRTKGHTETTISGDTRADWSEAFELVPSLQIAYVWHASKFTREVARRAAARRGNSGCAQKGRAQRVGSR